MKWHEIAFFTADVAAMTNFYHQLFGRAPDVQSENMAIFMHEGVKLFIHAHYEPEAGDLPPENHLALAVPDVDATCAELTARGMALEVAPRDYYWGRSAYLRDPEGHLWEITSETG